MAANLTSTQDIGSRFLGSKSHSIIIPMVDMADDGDYVTASTMPLPTLRSLMLALPPWLRRQSSALGILVGILPSFVADHINHKPRKASSDTKISALDGLRGLCCLMVLHMHWAFAVTDSNEGGSAAVNTDFLFHRPFFYLLWAGTSHVYIFFVMSGYVLSVKCLNMIHQGLSIHKVITSAVFRRAIRIFLPPLVLLFIYLLAIRAHVFDRGIQVFNENRWYGEQQVRYFESPPQYLPDFSAQFWDVLGAAQKLLDPATHFGNLPEYGNYDTHLWTMPVEFYCSMTLFVVLLATCQLKTRYRVSLHGALVLWCWLTKHTNHGLFFAGLFIAEMDILAKRSSDLKPQLPTSLDTHDSIFHKLQWGSPQIWPYLRISNIISVIAFVWGLYILSMPLLWADETPGYTRLLSYMPSFMGMEHRMESLRALGAVLAVWPITYASATSPPGAIPITRFFLANPVSKYLGQISFALYLVHGFVIRSLGYSILPSIYNLVIRDPERRTALAVQRYVHGNIPALSRLTPRELGTIWVLGYLIVLPACIWAADLFYRVIDVKSVSLGRWIEQKMTKDEPAPRNGPLIVVEDKIY